MSFMSDYEKLRLKNIEENKKVLAGLGFNKPFLSLPKKPFPNNRNKQVKRKRSEVQRPRKEQARAANDALDQSGVTDQGKPTRRRSGRLLGKEPGDFQGLDFDLEEEEEKPRIKSQRNRENIFGAIPGIDVGTTWSTRLACSADGVHRPTVAGIHGNTEEGCYSIALSGGYEDDLDYGECFTYTGEGGRDLKGTKANPKNLRTAPQSKDQTLTRGNLALTRNVEKGRPVRVIRGYKLDSPFAPDEGYRYDGIYTVEKYWHSVGLSGFMVFKFVLKRCDNQTPAVWGFEDNTNDSCSEEASENGITEKLPNNPPSKDQKLDNGNSDVTNNDAKYENRVGDANEVEKENEIEEMEEESNKEHQEEDDEVSETKELVADDIIHENAVSDANENKENDIEEIDKEEKDGECNEEHDNEVSETPKETEGLDNKQDE